jgi:CRISPR/Cas system-associated exonuclease Cas4 (RecB family)
MAKLPDNQASPTVQKIYKHYEESRGGYLGSGLGASLIGKECAREAWYKFRWCDGPGSGFSGRMLRLFETGELQEPRVVKILSDIKCKVHVKDPYTERQFHFTTCGGHISGSIDGVVLGLAEAPKTWHLLEVKTHSEKSFNHLKKNGVERSKPEHAVQMMIYMGLAELTRAMYFAVNKNTDELYTERLKFDKKKFKVLIDKGLRIINATEPMAKIRNDDKKPPCVWCGYRNLCHGDIVPPVSCRTCVHATPHMDPENSRAMWKCELHDELKVKSDQKRACDDHIYIPPLIPYAHPVDSGDGPWVAYKMNTDDRYFLNCGKQGFPAVDVPHYTSSELFNIKPDVIGDKYVEKIREMFDAEVVG